AVPLGLVCRSALPALLTGAGTPIPSPKTHRIAVVRDGVATLMQRDRTFARAPKQRAVYELLESLGGRATAAHLVQQLECAPSVLTRMVERGLITMVDE